MTVSEHDSLEKARQALNKIVRNSTWVVISMGLYLMVMMVGFNGWLSPNLIITFSVIEMAVLCLLLWQRVGYSKEYRRWIEAHRTGEVNESQEQPS